MVNADDVNILGGNVHTIKENTESLLAASKDTGLEVNADTTNYIVVSGGQNAGRSRNIKINSICFEWVE
jgi:hypothetical protein